jgi:TorA maturation chaperone TorD
MPTRSDGTTRLAADDLALARSAMWEALALGLGSPTAQTVARLASAEGAEALADVAAGLDLAGGAEPLAPLARALAVEPPPTVEALRLRSDTLFGHTARGPVPPYETEYGEDSPWAPPREMSDLGGFFRAFGLRLDPGARERQDHIACQCEFLLVLARKEARALALGDAALARATASAARVFLRDHLGRFAPAVGTALARLDPGGFHGALGRLLVAFVAAECARTGVTPGPVFLRLRSAEPDDTPVACAPSAGR